MLFFFFFNDTATTEIYTLSLHDALPISVNQTLDEYTEAAIQRLLTEHPSLGEQGITLTRREHPLVLSGAVESPQRSGQIKQLVHAAAPDVGAGCGVGVTRGATPAEHLDPAWA